MLEITEMSKLESEALVKEKDIEIEILMQKVILLESEHEYQ